MAAWRSAGSKQQSVFRDIDLDFDVTHMEDDNESIKQDVMPPPPAPDDLKSNALLFRPARLLFSSTPICIPSISEFEIINPKDIDVELYAVESLNTQFQSVMFQPQTIPALGNAIVPVIFLPYILTASSTELKVNSSLGVYHYKIEGIAVANPYRLHPFLFAPGVVGHPIEDQIIKIFNPHRDPVHILEIFTTVDFINLKGFPINHQQKNSSSNDMKQPQENVSISAWMIQPGEEKEIIRFSLSTSTMTAGVHSGFIHIKTDLDHFAIRVEIELTQGRIGLVTENLDFGVVTNRNQRKTLDLVFFNNGEADVMIMDVYVQNRDPQVEINLFSEPMIESYNGYHVKVGTITFIPQTTGEFHGKLVVVTNLTDPTVSTLEIDYFATVFLETVELQADESTFVVGHHTHKSAKNVVRTLHLSRFFSISVDIVSIEFPGCREFLSINYSHKAITRNESAIITFHEQLFLSKVKDDLERIPKTCWMDIVTNYTLHKVPLYIIDGLLQIELINAVSGDRQKYVFLS